ncbi:MAG TPA: hypothetical protein VFS08_17090 [Gemmatimonadaceae bacterium]|nr:hypothetical protein [Gemmatimonadaceae bacterium]
MLLAARLHLRAPARRVALALLLAAVAPPLAAQSPAPDDSAARVLAERATARRALQLADTALRDYEATAHGFLTFLAQVGEGFPDPPKVVKADELAVKVYWAAPDRTKQILVGQRDTLLLPGDVGYYRDRYGIVQNNFPDRIVLGDGNDVRDVPHPLSEIGLREYRFTLGDSLRIRLAPDRTISVLEVEFRPVDDRQPRAVGSLYIDRETADVVRMSMTFTDAAILDKRIETLVVTLENGLVDGRFWLPRHQELEVARTSTWLDFPARGIIRGRWEVDDYQVNQGLASTLFGGPRLAIAPAATLRSYPFEGPLLAQLPPDVQAVTEADVERVRAQAEALVREQALRRARTSALSARRVSDFLRVNRVEGLALGAGGVWRPTPALTLSLRGRYGTDDAEAKGRVSLARPRGGAGDLELYVERDYREAGDVAEVSLTRNSIAAQEFGSDYTDPYDVRAVGARVGLGERWGRRWALSAAYEEQRPLMVHATPSTGHFEPTLPAARLKGVRASLVADRPLGEGLWGTQVSSRAELRGGAFGGDTTFGRLSLTVEATRRLGAGELAVSGVYVISAGDLPPQELALFGGPMTGPGYAYHSLAGRHGGSERLEWRVPVPFASIPLGRFGSTPPTMTLAPYVHAAFVRGDVGDLGRGARTDATVTSVGVAGLFLFDLLRVDVARGLRDGRWMFGIDVTRAFWGVL